MKRNTSLAISCFSQVTLILILSSAPVFSCYLWAASDLYLEVGLNGQPTQLVARFSEHNGLLSIDAKSLAELGLNLASLGLSASQRVNLDQLPGVTYSYDAGRQYVDLQLADSLREVQHLGRQRRESALPDSDPGNWGGVLNYDAYASRSDNVNRLALWTEQRYFDSQGVFSNTGTAYSYRNTNQQHYVRFDSSWSHSDPQQLVTWQLGDSISGSLDWTRSVRLGGVQYRSNFALSPDMVTFPLPAYSGSASVPSAVSLYVNGIQRYSGAVNNGPFIIDQTVPGITGSGEAVVVTQDALGRSLTTAVPLYVDTRLMASGLASYSLELGQLRHDYAVESFKYASRPASSGSLRYGVSDRLTLEGHGELSEGIYNAGGGALYQLGQKGVVNGSLAASAGMAGVQWGLGYSYSTRAFSVQVQTLRSASNYGDLAAYDGSPLPSITDRLTLSFPIAADQNMSLSYLGYQLPGNDTSHTISFGHSRRLLKRLTMVLSFYQDMHDSAVRGAFASFSFALGERTSISSSLNYQNKHGGSTTSINRIPEYAGGWGWAAQFRDGDGSHYQAAQARYLGRNSSVTASVQEYAGNRLFDLDSAGSVVWLDGHLAMARRIGDGFALVSTDGVAGVPVKYENREIGLTDKQGYLLVPDLDAYRHNKVSINSLLLPANLRVTSTERMVVPHSRSGVLVHFPIQPYRAASVILLDAAGEPIPPGLSVRHVESASDTVMGYEGTAFIENLAALNHLQIDGDQLHCRVRFTYLPPTDSRLPTLGPLTCLPIMEGVR